MIDEKTYQEIEDYFAGELNEEQSKNLLTKVNGSEELMARFRESENLWNYMSSLESIEPRPDFIQKFWNAVSQDEEKKNSSFFNFNFLNRKWAFVSSLAVFLLLSTIIINNFVVDEEKSGYVYDADDELLVNNLDEALSKNTPEGLNVYGPWDDLEN